MKDGGALRVRPAGPDDHGALWEMLRAVRDAGDTYTFPADMTREAALAYWCAPSHTTFVAEHDGAVLGTYYLRANQPGGGAHVCNCGYITARQAQGRGVARTMLAHSLDMARAGGYRAMQYNFVVSTNIQALTLWRRAGFEEVGRLPLAFHHPTRGYVDALVLMKSLTGPE